MRSLSLCLFTTIVTIIAPSLIQSLEILSVDHSSHHHHVHQNNVILSSSSTTSSSSHRQLQPPGYEISEPKLTYSGLSLHLDFELSDQINPNQVHIIPYSDEACTASIEFDNDYLIPEITFTDDPTGPTQKVRVLYNIDPVKIQSSPVWLESSDKQFFISLCVGIWLYNGDYQNDPSAFSMYILDTFVTVQVDLKGDFAGEVNVGPKGPNEEVAEQVYFVEAFICDPQNNEPLQFTEPRRQGSSIRVCVKPTNDALRDGVYMRSINFFTFIRTNGLLEGQDIITQPALINEESANKDLTQLTCVRGMELCFFDTLLKSDFFFSPGILGGYGEAFLQFGSGQLRRLKIQSRNLQENGRVEGGFAGSSAFEVSFFVIPPEDGFLYKAEAYHCDVWNQELEEPIKPKTLYDNSIRICVRPDKAARELEITINSIDFWNFTRDELNLEQAAISPPGREAENGLSILMCIPGSPICAFRTQLDPAFYASDGIVGGIGSVWLQYRVVGTSISRRLKEPVLIEWKNRRTQELMTTERPLGFAGESEVGVDTPVAHRDFTLPEHCRYDHEVAEWWLEEDINDRYMYIGFICGTATALCCLFTLCAFCPLGRRRRRVKEEVESENNVKVNIGMKSQKIEENYTSISQSTKDVKNVSMPGQCGDSHVTGTSSEKSLGTSRSDDEELGLQRRGHKSGDKPEESDVCFDQPEHPGTLKFIRVVQKTIKGDMEADFSPTIYKSIKGKLSGSLFYIGTDKAGYSQASKRELIELISRAFAEEKEKLQRSPNKLITNGAGEKDREGLRKSNSLKRPGSNRSLKGELTDDGGDPSKKSTSNRNSDDKKMKRSGSTKSLKQDLDEGDSKKLKSSGSVKSLNGLKGEEGGSKGSRRRLNSEDKKLKRAGSSKSLRSGDLEEEISLKSPRTPRKLKRSSSTKSLRRDQDEDLKSESTKLKRSSSAKSLRRDQGEGVKSPRTPRRNLKSENTKMKRSSSAKSLQGDRDEDFEAPKTPRRNLKSDSKKLKRANSAPSLEGPPESADEERSGRSKNRNLKSDGRMKNSSSNRSLERGLKEDDEARSSRKVKRSSSDKSLARDQSNATKLKRSGSTKSLKGDLEEASNSGSRGSSRQRKSDDNSSLRRSGSNKSLKGDLEDDKNRSPSRPDRNLKSEDKKLKQSNSNKSLRRDLKEEDEESRSRGSSRTRKNDGTKKMIRSSSTKSLNVGDKEEEGMGFKSPRTPRRNLKNESIKIKRSSSTKSLRQDHEETEVSSKTSKIARRNMKSTSSEIKRSSSSISLSVNISSNEDNDRTKRSSRNLKDSNLKLKRSNSNPCL